jgi:hypothetical protein
MWFGWYDIPYESNVIIYVLTMERERWGYEINVVLFDTILEEGLDY